LQIAVVVFGEYDNAIADGTGSGKVGNAIDQLTLSAPGLVSGTGTTVYVGEKA
jgi:hypothetical protein